MVGDGAGDDQATVRRAAAMSTRDTPPGWYRVCAGEYRRMIDGRQVTVRRENRHRWIARTFGGEQVAVAPSLGAICAAAEMLVDA
jgi:hypothetical protein